jgi:hypothetical protein
MAWRCTRRSPPNYFVMTSYHWNAGKTNLCKQCKYSVCLTLIHLYYVSRIHGHIMISKEIVSIFLVQVKKRCCTIVHVQWHWKWSNSNVTFVNERQQITWRHAHNVVSLRVLYKFVNFISTIVICLKSGSIKMLDKLITFIVCWYKTLYLVLPVAWTIRITTPHFRDVVILVHTIGSNRYKVLYQHTMYIMGIYRTLCKFSFELYSGPPDSLPMFPLVLH